MKATKLSEDHKKIINKAVAENAGYLTGYDGEDNLIYPVKTKNGGYEAIFDIFADSAQGAYDRELVLPMLVQGDIIVIPRKGYFEVATATSKSLVAPVVIHACEGYPLALGLAAAKVLGLGTPLNPSGIKQRIDHMDLSS